METNCEAEIATSSSIEQTPCIATTVKRGKKRTVPSDNSSQPQEWKNDTFSAKWQKLLIRKRRVRKVAAVKIVEKSVEEDVKDTVEFLLNLVAPLEESTARPKNVRKRRRRASEDKELSEAKEKRARRQKSMKTLFKLEALKYEPLQNLYPVHVSSQKERRDLVKNANGFKLNGRKFCFICGEGATEEKGKLGQCERSLGADGDKSIRCNKRAHLGCTQDYNAGGAMLIYACLPECQDAFICPDHFCRACDLDNLKQYAYVGDTIRCIHCVSSYHKECIPIGSKLFKVTTRIAKHGEVEMEMIVCPAHFQEHVVGTHMKICKCQGSREVVKCQKCPQVFHKECRKVQTVDGVPVLENLCEDCAQHSVIRSETLVLVARNKKFEMGVTKSTNDAEGIACVEMCKNSELLQTPVSTIVRMKESFIKVAHYKNKKIWQENVDIFLGKPRFTPIYKKVRRKIDTLFIKDRSLVKSESENGDCSCTGENRCVDSTCDNRNFEMECPASCEKRGGCGNRKVSQKVVNPKMTLKEYESKGYGVMATEKIYKGEFLAEYAGEVIDQAEYLRRHKAKKLTKDKQMKKPEAEDYSIEDESHAGRPHRLDLDVLRRLVEMDPFLTTRDMAMHYFMDLPKAYIDAAPMGNISRYFNTSCDPNAQSSQIGTCRGSGNIVESAVFIKALRDIEAGEEITIDYKWAHDFFTCFCGAAKCKWRNQQ